MSLPGDGFIALWNDIAPHRVDYDAWHTIEHVPERLGVEGFLRAQRYALSAGSLPRYFTLYALDDLGVLDSEAYRRLIREPTAGTRDMRPDFRNFLRLVCRTKVTRGAGVGGYAAACLVRSADRIDALAICKTVSSLDGVSAAHFGEIDPGAVDLDLKVQIAPAFQDVTGVFVVEGYGVQALRRSCEAAALGAQHPEFAGWSIYKLAFELRKEDLGLKASGLRPREESIANVADDARGRRESISSRSPTIRAPNSRRTEGEPRLRE